MKRNYNENRGYTDESMSTYIRNYIDHPGDDGNLPLGKKHQKPTMEEISKSIESMIDIYKKNFISERWRYGNYYRGK